MGPKPSPQHTLDRIDSDGDYTPENCRWATKMEQNQNTSQNIHITFNGETLCIAEWSRRTGLGRNSIMYRLAKGWSVEKILTTPSLGKFGQG